MPVHDQNKLNGIVLWVVLSLPLVVSRRRFRGDLVRRFTSRFRGNVPHMPWIGRCPDRYGRGGRVQARIVRQAELASADASARAAMKGSRTCGSQ